MKRKIESIVDEKKNCKVHSGIHIPELPVDALILIFKKFTPSERRNFLLVCKKWLQIGSDYFVHDSCVKLTEFMDYSRTGPLCSTFAKKKVSKNRKFDMLINAIPTANSDKFLSFINLISEKIRNLKILLSESDSLNDIKRIYVHMTCLESLEIVGGDILYSPNLVFPKNLHTAKIRGKMCIFSLIGIINRISSVKQFTCETVRIPDISIMNEYGSFMSNELKTLLGEMMMNDAELDIMTDYNFCAERKMTYADIIGLKFSGMTTTVTPIVNLQNLKELKIDVNEHFDYEQFFGTNAITHTSITKLKIKGYLFFNMNNNINVANILICFPNVEELNISNISLTAADFTYICKHFPKLKKLVLRCFANKFSIENLFSDDKTVFALKNLQHLEKLDLRCDVNTDEAALSMLTWPHLPNLKELSLNIWSFYNLKKKTFTSIAKNSPNIIDFQLDCFEINNDVIIPLLYLLGKNLKHLLVTGDGESVAPSNDKLANCILKNCKNLETLSLNDENDFILIQEAKFFEKIPSLRRINYYSSSCMHRTQTRWNFLTLKPILKSKIL